MMRLALVLLALVITACGSKDVSSPTPVTLPVRERLAQKLELLYPTLLKCDGGVTDNRQNAFSTEPNCDTGDSIAAVGSVSLVHFEESFESFIANSIGADGTPYRSPTHKRYCDGTGLQDPSCSFSRDHFLGHMLYALGSNNPAHLSRIVNTIVTHQSQVCSGTYAQCGITPAVWDILGDTLRYFNLPRPAKTYVPDFVTALTHELSMINAPEYSLNLIAEMIHIKILTGNYSTQYDSVVDKLNRLQPTNLYFQFLKNWTRSNSQAEFDRIAEELTKLIDRRIEQGPGWVWLWSWPNEPENMNGWDLLFLGKLLLKHQS